MQEAGNQHSQRTERTEAQTAADRIETRTAAECARIVADIRARKAARTLDDSAFYQRMCSYSRGRRSDRFANSNPNGGGGL